MVIVSIYNGKIKRVERYKNNEETQREYKVLRRLQETGQVPSREYELTELVFFD